MCQFFMQIHLVFQKFSVAFTSLFCSPAVSRSMEESNIIE